MTETSPSELLDEVDLELGVCPYWIRSYGYCSTILLHF